MGEYIPIQFNESLVGGTGLFYYVAGVEGAKESLKSSNHEAKVPECS